MGEELGSLTSRVTITFLGLEFLAQHGMLVVLC